METGTVPLRKLDDWRWEIPVGSRPGMRVPGLVFSSERMIQDLLRDKSLEQVANVATLPGIVKASMAMPDIHWGYGFPIGGVAATDPEQGGVISPGGVGYDINCLSGDTRVVHQLGYHRTILDIVRGRVNDAVSVYDLSQRRRQEGGIVGWLQRRPVTPVLEAITVSGRRIVATSDHPFLTPDGMKLLGSLSAGDRVAVDPFEGVLYEEPSADVLADEDRVRLFFKERDMEDGNKIEQIIRALTSRGLLPLRYDSPALPYLIKVLGFVIGDGSLYFQAGRGKGIVCFFGQPEDLEDIRRDLSPWWTVTRVYSRLRKYKILTEYGEREFEGTDNFCRVSASSLAVLLALLGCPVGNKAAQDYGVPGWLYRAPLWQKRLFLAAYFGAELQSPRACRDRNLNFPMPLLTVQKRTACVVSGRRFLKQIGELAKEFGVGTAGIEEHYEGVQRKGGTSVRLRLAFSSRPDSLLALYTRIGFEYNRKKRAAAAAVAAYIGCKKVVLKKRQDLVRQIAELRAATGFGATRIAVMLGPRAELQGDEVNRRFIERTLYGGQGRITRTVREFMRFDQFQSQAGDGLNGSDLVWETIEKIETHTDVDRVYDITVNHPDHNFVANGFVVHNCGVRLVRTSLTETEVRPLLQPLVAQLFRDIPAGVGQEGEVRFTDKQERQILEQGSSWIVKQGYGTPQDVEHTEASGCLEGANADNVSERAYERGRGQVGTLGSGNHFLEVQAVDRVYDPEAAQTFGVREGQVLVMIHSGSRGLGYQVCDDYLEKTAIACAKYGISLPDRQLVCAPVNSPEGQAYLGAMRAAANYAWANRQLLMHRTREVFERVFGKSWQGLGMSLLYDVAHNIAKMERYRVDGKEKILCVHRKGATRAFPKGHPELSVEYRHIGQPVIIPGDMGRNSYLLAGSAAEDSFGSTCHGAGRVMSRTAAVRSAKGRSIRQELEQKGIIAMARGRTGLDEEQPDAYKDINEVVDLVHQAGLSRRVCRMKPMGVIKG